MSKNFDIEVEYSLDGAIDVYVDGDYQCYIPESLTSLLPDEKSETDLKVLLRVMYKAGYSCGQCDLKGKLIDLCNLR